MFSTFVLDTAVHLQSMPLPGTWSRYRSGPHQHTHVRPRKLPSPRLTYAAALLGLFSLLPRNWEVVRILHVHEVRVTRVAPHCHRPGVGHHRHVTRCRRRLLLLRRGDMRREGQRPGGPHTRPSKARVAQVHGTTLGSGYLASDVYQVASSIHLGRRAGTA